MGMQDRDHWREWFNERDEEHGFRRRPPEPPGADWHWSLKALVWLLIALAVYAVMQRLDLRRPTPPAAQAPHSAHTPHPAPAAAPLPSPAPASAPAPRAPAQAPVLPQTDHPPAPARVTIYLCKDYSGGMFWSSTHCNQHRALIDRMESVPGSLPFEQQVRLAEQSRSRAAALAQPPRVVEHHVQRHEAPTPNPSCAALSQRIVHLDNMARQPQSAQMQDWIAAEKAQTRSQQFRLRC